MSTRATWVFTVVWLTKTWLAISALNMPTAISFRTSSSRAVSSLSLGSDVVTEEGGRRTNSAITRRITEGARRASPAATARRRVTSFRGGRP
jgi:hypothetical protein